MAEPGEPAALVVEGMCHDFGGPAIVEDVSLSVASGDLLCIVGPSGCGKTTLLRLIAGLESLQRGRVAIAGRTVADSRTNLPPEDRGIGMVFQDYALFPHLSVADNVAFGLRGLSSADRRARAVEALALFNMAEYANSYPHVLSGGQQQRVALARAMAPSPRLMLLDEPFSDLDSRLRDRVRDETLHALKSSGAATLMVTHDPEEAMFMGDRIAVMRAGRMEQIGRPVALYFHPASDFVASFFSDVNRLPGVVSRGKVATPFGPVDAGRHDEGARVVVLIRPEALHLAWAPEDLHGGNVARVRAARLLGRSTLIHLDIDGVDGQPLHLHSRVSRHVAFAEGDEVAITLDVSQAFVFPAAQPT